MSTQSCPDLFFSLSRSSHRKKIWLTCDISEGLHGNKVTLVALVPYTKVIHSLTSRLLVNSPDRRLWWNMMHDQSDSKTMSVGESRSQTLLLISLVWPDISSWVWPH